MKKRFLVDQKKLSAILAGMQPICTKRTTVDATNYIMFHVGHRELVLKATDLEVSLQASCTIQESTLAQAESFLVSGKRIFEIVKELDGAIVCDFSDNQLMLQSDTVNLSLNIKHAQEFPPFPERIENLMHLDAAHFSDILSHVSFLIPQNNANPALNGLFLELGTQLTMTATDGHCLAQVTTEQYNLEKAQSWLLPRRAVFELKKLLETSEDRTIFLGTCGNQLVFSGESFNFFTKILTYAFPQYRQILDKTEFIPASVDRNRFIKTLKRSACLLSGQFIATRFGFSAHSLRVSLHNKEVGKLDEELALTGFDHTDALDIRFYAPYLLHGLQTLPDNEVTFFLQSNSKPIIFESRKESALLTYLVMPVSPTHSAS